MNGPFAPATVEDVYKQAIDLLIRNRFSVGFLIYYHLRLFALGLELGFEEWPINAGLGRRGHRVRIDADEGIHLRRIDGDDGAARAFQR